MTVVFFLIGALALLATVLLFGFVGCAPFSGTPSPEPPPSSGSPPAPGSSTSPGSPTAPGSPTPPDYGKMVLSTPDLVAYWRLEEPAATLVQPANMPALPGIFTARDAFGGFHGNYFKSDPVATPDDTFFSPASAGTLILGSTPGLLELSPQDKLPCMNTDGGYVQVPWADALNPPQFTLEAWVSPDPALDPKYYYCLAESTGPQVADQKNTGWGLYLGPDDPNNPSGQLFWQVWMGDGTQFNRVGIIKSDFPKDSKGQVISPLRLTYLVLTFDGTQNLQLWLYYPEALQMLLTWDQMQALVIPNPPIIFHRNDPSTDGQGDFFIGTGSNLTLNTPSGDRLYPFKGKIQEVALYKRDLSAPKNAGVQTTLASHEMAGGNM